MNLILTNFKIWYPVKFSVNCQSEFIRYKLIVIEKLRFYWTVTLSNQHDQIQTQRISNKIIYTDFTTYHLAFQWKMPSTWQDLVKIVSSSAVCRSWGCWRACRVKKQSLSCQMLHCQPSLTTLICGSTASLKREPSFYWREYCDRRIFHYPLS